MATPKTDEQAIRATIRALKANGYAIDSVYDGEEDISVWTEKDAIENIMAVDDARLYVRVSGHPAIAGWIRFVMGNNPDEVICDYTMSLDSVISGLFREWD